MIDSKTQYKLLLERPWPLSMGCVASAPMPQVLPGWGKEKNGDLEPCTKAESYFVNAKFFEEGASLKETMLGAIFSTSKRSKQGLFKILVQYQIGALMVMPNNTSYVIAK